MQAHHLSINIIGDAFADIYCYLEDGLPPQGGDSRLTKPMHQVAGGSGLNTATQLSSLLASFWKSEGSTLDRNARTSSITLQTVINENDDYGKLITSHCDRHGIALVNRRVSDHPACYFGTDEAALQSKRGDKSTAHCAVIVSGGDRSFMTHLGCMEDFRGSHVLANFLTGPKQGESAAAAAAATHHHVHVAGYYNMPGFWDGEIGNKLAEMRERQEKSDLRVTFSLVPQHDATECFDGGLSDILQYFDFLILSEVEARAITKYSGDDGTEGECDTEFFEHMGGFSREHSWTCIVVTRGAKGACAFHDGDMIHEQRTSAQIGDPADPTGAGDAFAAGFLHGYLSQVAGSGSAKEIISIADRVKVGMQWGCATGTCSVMVEGASVPPGRSAIERNLNTIVEHDSRKSNAAKRCRLGDDSP